MIIFRNILLKDDHDNLQKRNNMDASAEYFEHHSRPDL